MEFVDAKDPEWSDMWEELATYELNDGDPICVNNQECWEYMGSTRDHHHLRHGLHPKTEKIEFIYIERKKSLVNWL